MSQSVVPHGQPEEFPDPGEINSKAFETEAFDPEAFEPEAFIDDALDIELSPYVNQPRWEQIPLFCAVQAGAIEQVRSLLADGVDPNLRDCHGHTALMFANTLAIAHLLIAAGCDIHATNESNDDALQLLLKAFQPALEIGLAPDPAQVAIAQALIEAGGVGGRRSRGQMTPLPPAVAIELLGLARDSIQRDNQPIQ